MRNSIKNIELAQAHKAVWANNLNSHVKRSSNRTAFSIISGMIICGMILSLPNLVLADSKSGSYTVDQVASVVDPTISNETLGTRLLNLIGNDNKSATSDAVYRFGMGDQLKISFYGRDELSGTRTVDGLGRIYLPIIGVVHVKGKGSYQLQDELSRKYSKLSGQDSYVTVEVAQRRPFYVAGLVNQPGAHPFVPGIRVLQAVALSGGLYRQPLNSPTFIQSQREKMVYSEARITLQGAFARQARIMSDIKGIIICESAARTDQNGRQGESEETDERGKRYFEAQAAGL